MTEGREVEQESESFQTGEDDSHRQAKEVHDASIHGLRLGKSSRNLDPTCAVVEIHFSATALLIYDQRCT